MITAAVARNLAHGFSEEENNECQLVLNWILDTIAEKAKQERLMNTDISLQSGEFKYQESLENTLQGDPYNFRVKHKKEGVFSVNWDR